MRNPDYIHPETFSIEAPRPSPEILTLLSRCIEEGFNLDEVEALNDAYKIFSSGEAELINSCNELESKGSIDQKDRLYLVVLLASAKTLRPELEFVYQAFMTNNFQYVDVSPIINNPETAIIGKYLQDTIDKIKQKEPEGIEPVLV